MATYNGEKYLREQLQSLAEQERLPCEVVVSDDGSTDQTLQIVEHFSLAAPFPVRIIRQAKRVGFADNFLRAAENCTSDIISFCDQDDRWDSRKLALCLEEFSDPDILLCVHSATLWDGDSDLGSRWPDFGSRIVRQANSIDPLAVYPGFTLLFRNKLLKIFNNFARPGDIHDMSSPSVMMAHDKWICFLASIFGKIVCRPESLAFYRQHNQNTCGAPQSRTIMGRLTTSMKSRNYQSISELSLACAVLLESRIDDFPETFSSRAAAAAAGFRRRALYNRSRHEMFRDSTNLFDRIKLFTRIFWSAGYLPDPSFTRLGPKAGLKDLVFGVPGLYKLKF
jgi:glycosyltransferase involved in cell wall biosynthesis